MSEYGFFAFSEKQYAEGISKLQCDEVVTIPGGGFVRSDQTGGLAAMMDRHSAEQCRATRGKQAFAVVKGISG